jgi:hypothetical protein
MGDFVTRLVGQTLGLTPVVRPLISPTFAPEPAAYPSDPVWDEDAPGSSGEPDPPRAPSPHEIQRDRTATTTSNQDDTPLLARELPGRESGLRPEPHQTPDARAERDATERDATFSNPRLYPPGTGQDRPLAPTGRPEEATGARREDPGSVAPTAPGHHSRATTNAAFPDRRPVEDDVDGAAPRATGARTERERGTGPSSRPSPGTPETTFERPQVDAPAPSERETLVHVREDREDSPPAPPEHPRGTPGGPGPRRLAEPGSTPRDEGAPSFRSVEPPAGRERGESGPPEARKDAPGHIRRTAETGADPRPAIEPRLSEREVASGEEVRRASPSTAPSYPGETGTSEREAAAAEGGRQSPSAGPASPGEAGAGRAISLPVQALVEHGGGEIPPPGTSPGRRASPGAAPGEPKSGGALDRLARRDASLPAEPGTARRRRPDGSPEPGSQEPSAPAIRVSIGRIEVRAAAPPPAMPPARPAAPSGPALSLDDYLEQHNGRRR